MEMTACFLLFIVTCSVIAADNSQPEEPKKKLFRMEKMNYIYSKAIQHIDDKKQLRKLEDKLDEFDKIYAANKELEHVGKGKSKEELAQVDEKLLKLLHKFNLEKTLEAFQQKLKYKNDLEHEKENSVLPSEKFSDPALQKLWLTAKAGKFSESELAELHKGLKEHEGKIAHYEELARQFNKIPDHDENSVQDNHHSKTRELKDAHKEMHSHLEELHSKINDADKSPFRSRRVQELWAQAQKSKNFTVESLAILHEELKHFDLLLHKLSVHGEQLESMRNDKLTTGKDPMQHLEHQELEARHEKLTRKLRKMEKFIVHKIEHTEL